MKDHVLRAITALLVLAGLTQTFPSKVYACLPVPRADLQTARNNADAVFIGKVVAIDDSPFAAIGAFFISNTGAGHDRVLFNVTSVWKGSARSQAVVSVLSKVCGGSIHDFYKDESFLVFANNGATGNLEASDARELEKVAEDLGVLGESKPPMEQAELGTLFYFQSYWAEAGFGILLLVALFGLVRAKRARSRVLK
jgi:hypothetical protein